jgi:hypothetical protein
VKLFEPPYFCTYRGTEGLSLYETEAEDEANIGERLGKMRSMYSRFRPHQRELEEGGRRVLPRPGDVPGSRTFPGTAKDKYEGETVKQTLSLEGHELFTQLVSQTNLVKIGPRHGLFTCFVDVEEGVMRVWKDWLAETAAKGRQERAAVPVEAVEAVVKGKEIVREKHEEKVDMNDPRILWVSASKDTGISFNVKERKFRRETPILLRTDEDMPVTYEIEYDGRSRDRLRAQQNTNAYRRVVHTDVPPSTGAREVISAGRQLIGKGSGVRFLWLTKTEPCHARFSAEWSHPTSNRKRSSASQRNSPASTKKSDACRNAWAKRN